MNINNQITKDAMVGLVTRQVQKMRQMTERALSRLTCTHKDVCVYGVVG